jgi:hypothetical protein
MLQILGGHAVRNIVEEQGKVLASQPQHLLEPLLQMDEISLIAVADVQSGAERVDEPEAPLLAGADHFAERAASPKPSKARARSPDASSRPWERRGRC